MISRFNYYQPTEIIFGAGRVAEIGDLAKQYGSKALLVTVKEFPAVAPLYSRVKEALNAAGILYKHFDGVIPNPTTEVVNEGSEVAKSFGAEVIIGLGGGSSMDTAKAIAVGASHPGTAWDYLHYKTQPTKKTLPIIAITTTSGTGSQITQCAVITNPETKDKSAIWHPNIYPKIAVIDPELMVTLPKKMTATTGFDALAHNFEAYISNGASAYTDTLALEGIKTVIHTLPLLLSDLANVDLRSEMAWADTLGGLVITQAGVTLPHGLGMQISGHCPHVAHGESLAVTYPEFTRYTYQSSIAKFAAVGRIFNPDLLKKDDVYAAKACCEEFDEFLKAIGMWMNFRDLQVSMPDIREIANCGQVLNDYKNNPRIATIDEMYEILVASYDRT